MDSDLLHTEKILADRKTFFLDLKENSRGMVVKITEDVSGNRDTIMVPAEILGDFIAALTGRPAEERKAAILHLWSELPPAERTQLEAYSAGVNAGLAALVAAERQDPERAEVPRPHERRDGHDPGRELPEDDDTSCSGR